MRDEFNLQRFVDAQASTYATALDELRAGRKRSHWMWFIFPQLRQLGRSATAQFYGIGSFAEATAYYDHALLGPRLVACTLATLSARAPSLNAYLGTPDDLKFRSSMTLFSAIAPDPQCPFMQALERWCDGKPDGATLDLLSAS
jgi:uncharacterized protein (DUF1810 family)